MVVAVGERTAETLQADDVGMRSGVTEQRGTVPSDQDGQPILGSRCGSGMLDPEVLAVAVDRLTVEQCPDDLDALGEPLLADHCSGAFDAGRRVLLRRVPRTETELETPTRQHVDRGDVPCELHRDCACRC